MSGSITAEAALFFTSVWLGCRMMLFYDGLRLYRWLVPHSRLARDAEDILYWIYCALWAFAVLFRENSGNLRWFYLAGIAVGMILWNLFFSKTLKKGMKWVKMKRNERLHRT